MSLGKFGSFMDMMSPIVASGIGGGIIGSFASANAPNTFLFGAAPAGILAIISSLCIFTMFSRLHISMALMGFGDLTGFEFEWGD